VTVWSGPYVNGFQCTFEVYDARERRWHTIKGKELHGSHHGYATTPRVRTG
jgi:hypothetical protein